MPLIQSDSREAVSENIRRELAAGKPEAQSIAIALNTARRAGHAHGGSTTLGTSIKPTKDIRSHLDFGGVPSPPWYAREEARQDLQSGNSSYGLVGSSVAGRTDRHNVDVPAGTYVLPADVVAGVGQDNNLAGAGFIHQMLTSGPYGTQLPRGGRAGIGIPSPPPAYREPSGPTMAKGGSAGVGHNGGPPLEKSTVPVVIAGGEFLIDPDTIAHHPLLGNLNPHDSRPASYEAALKRGHGILDAFVKHSRAKHIKTLKSLPGPKR